MSLQKSPYSLKIDDLIFRKTKELASKDKRTLNMEIEYILERYIDEYEDQNGSLCGGNNSASESNDDLPF